MKFCLIVLLVAFCSVANAQQQADVVRVDTELVQTAVTVLDKKGNFVEGLQRDQFELIVDGKPRPIAFFERVASGSARERELAAPGNPNDATAKSRCAAADTRAAPSSSSSTIFISHPTA